MAKPKVNVQELLLKKGEYLVLGVAGFGLVVLLLWGVTTWAGAANPTDISKELTQKTSGILNSINNPNAPDEPAPLAEWAKAGKKLDYPFVPPKEFPIHGPQFDPVGRPDTKRENPTVLGIEEYQVDLVRAPMKGFDINEQGDSPLIAVKVQKKQGEFDAEKVKKAVRDLDPKWKRAHKSHRDLQNTQQNMPGGPGEGMPGGPMEPGGFGPGGPGGPGGFPPGGPGGGPGRFPPGGPMGPGGMPGMGRGQGFGNHGFDANAQRSETDLIYIPVEELDAAITAGKLPALTVIPLRLAVVNATFPLKKQIQEVRRAMRFKDDKDAAPFVHFDGFEVRRRVILPSGTILGTDKKYDEVAKNPEEFKAVGFFDYNYQDKYISLIDARKTNDYLEGGDPANPDGAYLSYFYRYEDALVMPLPELVPELGHYPRVNKLKSITQTIEKMKAAGAQKESPSDLAERLLKKGGHDGKKDWMIPKSATQIGAGDIFGAQNVGKSYLDAAKMMPGGPRPGDPKRPPGGVLDPNNQAGPQVEVDHLLVRFLDCDIQPGFTYEYQIRVRMANPNWGGRPEYMANPKLATEPKYQTLSGPWVTLGESLTVPRESFLYAADPAAYRAEMAEAHKGHKALLNRLQAKDDQAVVQEVTWLPEVRTDTSNQREPVGAWVAAQVPVGRGDFIGKRTFVKLPLWSSEANQYTFREHPAMRMVKGAEQPKGWLVDFSSQNILVDFEGGRVRTKASGGRGIDEDVATELLILQPDGKLLVRKSADDAADPNRKELTALWDSWLRKVETRPAAGGPGGPGGNMFDRGKKE